MEKRRNGLRALRWTIAALVFVPILLYFVDFRSIMPEWTHVLLHAQLMPAILSGLFVIVIAQLIIAFVFGRWYCSVICPAGVLQDIINRIFCIGRKKKNGKMRFSYRKPYNALRYSVLALTAISMITGFMTIALMLDPYSNFGRIATNLFRPVVIFFNNITADQLAKIDNYTLYHITINTIKTSSLVAAVTALVVFVGLTVWRGRLFCNTLCPVGAFLSLLSRYSLFKISFDEDKCNKCGTCSRSCKAEAIDSTNQAVDTSKCVDCMNCVSVCPKGALSYKYVRKPAIKAEPESNGGIDRRGFIATTAMIATTVPLAEAVANKVANKVACDESCESGEKLPITPPGSISLEHFKEHCTGCQLCVARCPNQVLKPTGLQYGLNYLLKPEMDYFNSYCNYECTICSQVCPVGAIKPITAEEKITTQIGVAHFHKDRCVVYKFDQDCGACAEHCPTQAVHMVPYKGTLTIPQVDPALCVGCGGCESICPVRPERAIVIEAQAIHQKIEPPVVEEVKEIEVTDFGF